MPIKTENELTPASRALWLKALAALEQRNFGYTVTLLQPVLKEEPGFLAGRQVLRKAAIEQQKGKKSFFKLGSLSSMSSKKIDASKDPAGAMDAAEKALVEDPYNIPANLAIRDAAMALELPEVATFALETLSEGHPKDTKILHELARHYTLIDKPERAVHTYARILKINSSDLEAVKGEKDASARSSMKTGGWEHAGEGDYRNLIKNKEEAVSIEQQNRVVLGGSMIENQLSELHARVETEPSSVDLARRIAELYEKKEDFATSQQWFQYAADLTGGTDDGMLRKAHEMEVKALELNLRHTRQQIEEGGADPETLAALKQREHELDHQRESILIGELRSRILRNPTDLNLRFELGEHLVHDGQFSEAIPELQKARNSPNLRVRTMALLGQCFHAKGMLDLARSHYEEAVEQLPGMDGIKKDILYRLALLHETAGNSEAYVASLKSIYQADYEYRDVAERVEAWYQKDSATPGV